MARTIRYLNTDLDLKSPRELGPLVAALSRRGVYSLHGSQVVGECGERSVTCEADTSGSSAEPEADLVVMLAAIEALSPDARAAWDACTLREFNIGYDCGDRPWAFNNGLSNATLRRIAEVGGTLRITIYPVRGDEDEDDDETGASS